MKTKITSNSSYATASLDFAGLDAGTCFEGRYAHTEGTFVAMKTDEETAVVLHLIRTSDDAITAGGADEVGYEMPADNVRESLKIIQVFAKAEFSFW